MAKKKKATVKTALKSAVRNLGRKVAGKPKKPAKKSTGGRSATSVSTDLGRAGKKVRGEAAVAALPKPVKKKGKLAAEGRAAAKNAAKKVAGKTSKRTAKAKVRPVAGSWGSEVPPASAESSSGHEPAKLAKALGRRRRTASSPTFQPGGPIASVAKGPDEA